MMMRGSCVEVSGKLAEFEDDALFVLLVVSMADWISC
jgi:hypothetical protein